MREETVPYEHLRRDGFGMIGAEEYAMIPYWILLGRKKSAIRPGYHLPMHRHMQPYRRVSGSVAIPHGLTGIYKGSQRRKWKRRKWESRNHRLKMHVLDEHMHISPTSPHSIQAHSKRKG